MDSQDEKRSLEELKIASDDYRYRVQLMVTEFGLSMTALAATLNGVIHLTSDYAKVATLVAMSLFLLVICNHMWRINQDRKNAGRRKTELLNGLKMSVAHGGYAGRRPRFGVSAPQTMVYFCWIAFLAVVAMAIRLEIIAG